MTTRCAPTTLHLSGYLLAAALSKRTRGRADVDAINLLREIASSLKDLHRLIGATHGDQLQTALDETVAAIQRVWASAANRRR